MPSWFTRGRYTYRTPEWLPKEEIAARRVARLVGDHERDASRIASYSANKAARQKKSQQAEKLSREIKDFLQKAYDLKTGGQKERMRRSAQLQRSLFLTLERERSQRTKLSEEGWKKAQAAASDRRRFHPQRQDFDYAASTRFGTIAHTVLSKAYYPKMWAKDLPRYLNPTVAIPCIQRHARREVLFAKKLAGKGYRSPHHRNNNSGVPC